MSRGCFQGVLPEEGRLSLNMGSTTLWLGAFQWTKRVKAAECTALLCFLKTVAIGAAISWPCILPSQPCLILKTKTNPSSFKLLLSYILSNTSWPSAVIVTNDANRQQSESTWGISGQSSGLKHQEAWMFSKMVLLQNTSLWRKLDALIAYVKNTMWVPWDAFTCYSIEIESDHLNTQETNLSGESEGTAVYLNYWLFSCDLLADKRQSHAGILGRVLSQQFLLPSQIKNVWPNFAGYIYKSMC